MIANPALGVFFHWLGGLASGSFYVPFRRVRRWSWETYWLVGGFFSWIIAPWFLGSLMTRDLLAVLSETSAKTLFWAFFFGLLWGVGGLTFGLTMRFLGLSLGMAVVLGLCAALGTLMPPIFSGVFVSQGSGDEIRQNDPCGNFRLPSWYHGRWIRRNFQRARPCRRNNKKRRSKNST